MATDKTGDVQGSSSSGKSGGGKNISALLKKLKGKINKNSDQKNLQTGANKSTVSVTTAFPGPTADSDRPFVGPDAQNYLVKDRLKGFGFGQVVTDFGPPGTGFGVAPTGVQPFAFGGTASTPPVTPFGSPVGAPADGSLDLTAIPASTLPGTTTEGEGED